MALGVRVELLWAGLDLEFPTGQKSRKASPHQAKTDGLKKKKKKSFVQSVKDFFFFLTGQHQWISVVLMLSSDWLSGVAVALQDCH